MDGIILFEKKDDCCACGACINICPNQAIEMQTDGNGFEYPSISRSKCIECKKCKSVCAYQHGENGVIPVWVYASATKDNSILKESASGGIFTAIAKFIIMQGGAVYGCAFELQNGDLMPKHICIDKECDLKRLQGSKYVQSEIGNTYSLIKKQLQSGRIILFSGTPCQVAGLKGYIGKTYDNLYTIDVICHGVPSSKMFCDYVDVIMTKCKGEIVDFKFRDKEKGWGLNAKITWQDRDGRNHFKSIPYGASSYYDMFLKSEIYRENCYSCPYAGEKRVGDLTLGDFWGIQREHPEMMVENGGCYNDQSGISCVLVNTNKGKCLFDKIKTMIQSDISTFEKVARENCQLQRASIKPDSRNRILQIYRNNGYKSLDIHFKKRNGLRIQYFYLKGKIPYSLKNKIKRMIKR